MRHSYSYLMGSIFNSGYRMIPSIFAGLGRREAAVTGQDTGATLVAFKRKAAAVIGIAGAIGAFGGFLIQVAFRQSSLEIGALVKAAKTPAEKLSVAQAHADWSIPRSTSSSVATSSWPSSPGSSTSAARRRPPAMPQRPHRR